MKTYCKPLKRGASWRSQNFGANATIYGPHSGNDEACDIGTPVYAAGDGVVEWAGEFDDSYADNLLWLTRMGGNVLVLNCGDDEPSFVYAHLSEFFVRPGDRVKKGQHIANSGNSGTATTGAHLHVEVIPPGYVLNSPLLGRVNPDLFLTEWPDDVMVISTQSATVEIEDEELKTLTIIDDGSGKLWVTENFVEKWHIPSPQWIQHYLKIESWGWVTLRRSGKGPEAHIHKVPAFGAEQ